MKNGERGAEFITHRGKMRRKLNGKSLKKGSQLLGRLDTDMIIIIIIIIIIKGSVGLIRQSACYVSRF
jgi:hypothetical protein